MSRHISEVYASEKWESIWAAIVEKYENVSFRDLVRMPVITAWDESSPGDFGGMGMTADESAIFYAIGIGDGSWGAFYDVCSLYPMRTAIFGSAVSCNWSRPSRTQLANPRCVPSLAQRSRI